ncbi:MAG TPA: D-alanyl-D-alanine carboxypeptidase family protein [Acetobacteraceae bacterium]|nr:D-alanyl-D-alanine carboxypeptidase family protein [Acetobacteraceae bacterium]
MGIGLLRPGLAHAQVGSDRYSSMVVDAASGKILESVNPDAPRHPASLAKLMTLYLTFEALRDRRITLDTLVPVSAHAASMEPTKLGLLPGMRLTVQQAILGLVTRSANDAASALGELLGGSEDRFAQMMTLRARALGMSHTTFANASGLPDPDEWTTARDLAVLARHLISDFPGDYHYFSTPSFVFRGTPIYNHDDMLRIYPGADGMKTGYTDASGHNLITSAVRDGVRLIGVELGAGSNAGRDIHMAALLNQGYAEMGVPTGRRPTRLASTLGLIGVAHAATLEPPPVRDRAASARVRDRAISTRVRVRAVSAHIPDRAMGAPVRVRSVSAPVGWTVQVGVYAKEKVARYAAAAARRVADDGALRIEPATAHGRPAWRAQLTGMTAPEAQDACAMLSRHRTPCLVLRPEAREVASR